MLMKLSYIFKISIKLKNSNNYSPNANIEFTSEIEMDNSLSFPDIKIVAENNKITTSVYRKPKLSSVFTNFERFTLNTYIYTLYLSF